MICKSCSSNQTVLIFDFGMIPAVNNFIFEKEIDSEKLYKLSLYVCKKCWLIQLSNVPDPDVLFKKYHHVSGASQGNINHLSMVADYIKKHFPNHNKILEVGCNDGTLISFLNEKGYECFGIDPAKNINHDKNMTIYKDFFNTNFVKQLVLKNSCFDIVIGLNVFAHNDSFIDMFKASRECLSTKGVFIVEVAYAPATVGDGNFDTIYHEHVCSYSLFSLESALNSVGLYIFDAELINTQGGSIRIIANKDQYNDKSKSYMRIKNNELKIGLNTIEYYNSIKFKIQKKRDKISKFFEKIVKNNKKLLIVGAPARGVVTMNVCNNFDLTKCSTIVDDTIEKQNKIMPGSHITIISWDQCDFDRYDICIILSWNYLDYLLERLKKYNFNGQIYTPFPYLKRVN